MGELLIAVGGVVFLALVIWLCERRRNARFCTAVRALHHPVDPDPDRRRWAVKVYERHLMEPLPTGLRQAMLDGEAPLGKARRKHEPL